MYYVIPDIHGRNDLLTAALGELYRQNPDGGKIIFLGDYIDRGPDSLGVCRTVMNPPENWQFICLLGNHEDMFLNAYEGYENFYCRHTLDSFAPGMFLYMDIIRAIPHDVIAWMQNLPIWHIEGENVFVHAYFDPEIAPHHQRRRTLLWHRLGHDEPYEGKLHLVHGHTPNKYGPVIQKDRTNLDCGAVFYDRLVVAQMEEGLRGPVGFIQFGAPTPARLDPDNFLAHPARVDIDNPQFKWTHYDG